ncbi:Rv1733c family protein [Streptomyces ficellus]|uniref:Uncharacterized protein n=1 Tax=Streptomyces ficellus TaxID=1977088 RepID=A0A6I6FNR3_9ACTN|nr:hypothetical protein [Streptomyces ficellus]QGV81942.1 hypothetical protein EIZ62_29535 [Streptomyces ficellus]
MRAVVGLRRWRHNPLRRPTDLTEAWVAFAALLLMCVAAPAGGAVAGTVTHTSLQESARLQQEQRHPVTARVLPDDGTGDSTGDGTDDNTGDGSANGTAARDARTTEASAEHRTHRPVPARWTGPDGTRHTGVLVTTRADVSPGDVLRVWTDDRGRLVDRPMTAATARDHAVLAGLGTMFLTAGIVEGVRRVVVWRLVQRRYEDLDREWAQVGPDWGRTGAGS